MRAPALRVRSLGDPFEQIRRLGQALATRAEQALA